MNYILEVTVVLLKIGGGIEELEGIHIQEAYQVITLVIHLTMHIYTGLLF